VAVFSIKNLSRGKLKPSQDAAKINSPAINTLEEKYGLFTQSIAMRFDPSCVYYQYTPKLQEAQDLVNERGWLSEKVPLALNVTEDTDKYNSIITDLSTERDVMISKYILSDASPETIWEAWLEKAEKLGVSQVTGIYNKTYEQLTINNYAN
jgi:hypothetical protein